MNKGGKKANGVLRSWLREAGLYSWLMDSQTTMADRQNFWDCIQRERSLCSQLIAMLNDKINSSEDVDSLRELKQRA